MSVKQKHFSGLTVRFIKSVDWTFSLTWLVWLYSYIETIKTSPHSFTSAFAPTFKLSGRNMVIDNSMFKKIPDFSFNFVALSQFDLFRY